MPEHAKNPNVKVVRLEPESQRMARARIARLPAAVHAVHEKGKLMLMQKLRGFFDGADDSLFSLADKACTNQEQNIYFDSMREVRVQRRGFEKRFAGAIDTAFASLATGEVSTSTFDDSLNSDALSLVQNDELEELVAVESSVSRASTEFAEAIQLLSLRLDSLVPVKVFHQNNPLAPEIIANAFIDQARRLDIDIKAKLVLFKLFDRSVMQNLEDLYQNANQLLVDHNVLPSLTARLKSRSGVSSPASSSQMQQANKPSSNTPVDAASEVASNEVAKLLGGMIAGQQRAQAQSSAIDEIVHMLSLAQQAPMSASLDGNLKALDLITALQQRKGSKAEIARTEIEVIKLVDMLFNFILEDKNLAKDMKLQISRLQMPLVKVALLDKSFFAKGGHSARRLLNEIATAALGWQPGAGGKADPLYNKINDVITKLLNSFDTDVAIFNELLADFSSFIQKEHRRSEVMERRTLDAEDGKAKAEVSRTIVAIEIELRTIDQELPELIQGLINGPWSNVLFINNLKYGSESSLWLESLQTLEDLVWSVKTPRDNEQRKRLIKLVPGLLQRLRAGLDSISFNPFEMSEIFKTLEDIHLSCIRGKIESTEQSPALATQLVKAKAPSSNDSELVADELEPLELNEADELLADVDAALADASMDETETLTPNLEPKPEEKRQPKEPQAAKVQAPKVQQKVQEKSQEEKLSPDSTYMQQVASFVQGAWFEMVDDEGSVARCRLAAFIKPTGKYIFVNRNGMKVAEKPQHDLALMLKENRIRALDNSMLFDRALETVVSSLRKPQ
ncbi:Protein of unknown function [Alteromonadaceae bacterium Bs31]|nr:Protein of unknown function [Alteromonadaceae bacterium Bs31]